ncbi:spore germination protein [Clostridium kluyveri]|nr:spore germination protein [Clostridium kluyveri]UZQ51481.1 spore germination protein [Clostridium kluyveri]
MKASTVDNNMIKEPISINLNQNVEKMNEIFSYPINKDYLIKDIYIQCLDKKGSILCLDTIVDKERVESHIISPLMYTRLQNLCGDIGTILMEQVLTMKIVSKVSIYKDAIEGILNGDTILFVDGYNEALLIHTSKSQHRNIEKPIVENTLKGPQEAFTEWNEGNRSLIRKSLKNPQLITEVMPVGKGNHNEVFIMYIKNIVNVELLKEVKVRISKITDESIENASILEQWIEDRPYSILPSTIETERPDRVSSFLKEGHIALLIGAAPNVIIVPVTFWSFFHTSEDMYQRWMYGNFLRFIRIVAFFISLFLPGIYIAVSTYHVDMIPTDLVIAIAASREKLPLPVIFEIILMEISFELMREAGVRMPSSMGSTIGIVGALILGQAAVEATIVSPMLVIIVALTGLSSFAIPEMNLSFLVRIGRFAFLIVGAIGGLYGVGLLATAFLAYTCAFESFGIPFFSPKAPYYPSSKDFITRKPIFKQKQRPTNMNPQDECRQK